MTPAEKANELFDKFYKELDGYGILPPHHMQSMAKNLSIICVDQIIGTIESIAGTQKYMWNERERNALEYWQEVLAILKTNN